MPHKHHTRAEKPLEETSSRNVANNSKPPTRKPAWTNQQTKEPLKKNIRTEKEARIRSQRQRSYSEVENVEILYSAAQTKDKKKRGNDKDDPGLSRSKSEERLDSQDASTDNNVLTERSGLSGLSDDKTSTERSKFTSREPVVKSQKPTTKPLHLGKFYVVICFILIGPFGAHFDHVVPFL